MNPPKDARRAEAKTRPSAKPFRKADRRFPGGFFFYD